MRGFMGLNHQQRLLLFWFMADRSGLQHRNMNSRLEDVATLLMKTKMIPQPPSTIKRKHSFHLVCELTVAIQMGKELIVFFSVWFSSNQLNTNVPIMQNYFLWCAKNTNSKWSLPNSLDVIGETALPFWTSVPLSATLGSCTKSPLKERK